MVAIDFGCGSGQHTFRLAPLVKSVTAIDVSQKMIDLLIQNDASKHITNVSGKVVPIEYFEVESNNERQSICPKVARDRLTTVQFWCNN